MRMFAYGLQLSAIRLVSCIVQCVEEFADAIATADTKYSWQGEHQQQ